MNNNHTEYAPFLVKFREGGKENKWGIWIGIDCDEYLIDPILLGNSLFAHRKWQKIYTTSDLRILSQIHSETKSCYWAIERNNISHKYMFRISEYVASILRAIDNLHTAIMRHDKQLAYNFRPDLFGRYEIVEDLELIIRQINVMKQAIISPRMRSINNLHIERLSFDFNNRFSDENLFSIMIGGRQYNSHLAEWSNNFELIRHQLESIVYRGEAEIDLYNDTGVEASIHFEHETLKEVRQSAMRVTVFPAERDKPIVTGYCDRQQAVRALYQGLLNISRNGIDSEYKRDYDIDWDQYKFVIYNKLKSPLIENYIIGKESDDRICSIRQQYIKERYRMEADALTMIWDSKGCALITDQDDLFEDDGLSIKIDGIYQWYKDLDDVVDWTNSEIKGNFDWAAWHKRGLELAQNLRQQLPDEYDLWYSAPFEDKSGILKEDVLIIKQ